MSDAQTLLALAARCEAEEPSRNLDQAIWDALGGEPLPFFAPDVTSSLDAAVTLVPEGHSWHAHHLVNATPSAKVWPGWLGCGFDSHARTVVLALCAAALRACAALAEQSREPMQSGEATPPPQGSAP